MSEVIYKVNLSALNKEQRRILTGDKDYPDDGLLWSEGPIEGIDPNQITRLGYDEANNTPIIVFEQEGKEALCAYAGAFVFIHQARKEEVA